MDESRKTSGHSAAEVATAIADILSGAGAELVASLPDGWIFTAAG